jgi:outer membrane protein
VDVFEDYTIKDPAITTEIEASELASTSAKYDNFRDLSNRALAARPDYIGASENYSASESGVTAARSGYFPTVSAFAGYTLSSNELSALSNNKNINWGLNVRWTIFDGFQTNQSLQSAIATKRNAEISLKQAERDINVEVKKALLNLDAARKAYEVSQKGLVSSREDRKIAEERYNLGAGTLLDLLTANAGLVGAEASKVNASYDYIIAKRNVEYALGETPFDKESQRWQQTARKQKRRFSFFPALAWSLS